MKALLPLLASFVAFALTVSAAPPVTRPTTQPSTRPVKEIPVDLDKALKVDMPQVKNPLTPIGFKTSDGKEGWVLSIPGSRPIATPAYAVVDGRGLLFVGGGYGSHEFYAFDAATGEKVWEIKTGDDGPTAAVVEDGYVAFNTESCTVIIVEAKTGKVVWQEWLGDPLMSQPAIWKGKLYMAYPAGQRGGANTTNQEPKKNNDPPSKTSHRLLCADLKTGKHLWIADISGDVISAPVIDGGKAFFTCFNGTSYCVNADSGKVEWAKEHAGTSAPVVAAGQVILTQRRVAGRDTTEGISRLDPSGGEAHDKEPIAAGKAEYLKAGRGGNTGIATTQAASLDASVGFAQAPSSANLFGGSGGGGGGAAGNVGVTSIASGWAYQGSKAAYANGQILNAQGNVFNCVRADNGEVRWRGVARGKDVGDNAQVFAPPALGGKNMYLCSIRGDFLSVSQDDGSVRFIYHMGHPIAFQPALANGAMYAGTANGLLICLKTGDKDADGWVAWGGNAQHNKKE